MTIAPSPATQNAVREKKLLTRTEAFIRQLRQEGLLLGCPPSFKFMADVHQWDVKEVQTLIGQAKK